MVKPSLKKAYILKCFARKFVNNLKKEYFYIGLQSSRIDNNIIFYNYLSESDYEKVFSYLHVRTHSSPRVR